MYIAVLMKCDFSMLSDFNNIAIKEFKEFIESKFIII